MQRAKESVAAFIHKSGHHDTTVHETVAPAVQHETVKPHQHENVTVATDKEVHQDHYHHTVQPITDREVLPEHHEHNMAPVQHREVDHRDHDSVKRNVAEIQKGFRDEREVRDTTHSRSAAPAVGGEHVHHHIHETIQPVLHKETIQPHVVHTTVPIHEVHHNAVKHHETTELPPLSMAEFAKKGGSLAGREEKYDSFEGEPRNVAGVLGGHHHEREHERGAVGTGIAGHEHGHTGTTGVGHNHDHAHRTGATGGAVQGERRLEDNVVDGHHNNHSEPAKKPSLIKKLNPFTDTDGDGKKGVLE